MPNLRPLYLKRFQSYIVELQKYMQFIISGHIAVVLLFVIGAAGYSYSEWLKQPHPEFPTYALAALILTLVLLPNRPATLFQYADHYFFMPMEQSIQSYLNPALKWSVFVVIVRSAVIVIVLLPLLTRVGLLSGMVLWGLALLVIVLGYWNVHTKFRAFWYSSDVTLIDLAIRGIVIFCAIYWFLTAHYVFLGVVIAIAIFYFVFVTGKSKTRFPFERMIDMEQQRMQRFYQFANYFTEVPHLKSKVSRRVWFDGFLSTKTVNRFLVSRSYVRKDELFYMWLRLALLMVFAPLLDFSYLVSALVIVFAFAIAIQSYQGLLYNQLFRMDMLYPQQEETREQSAKLLVRYMSYIPLAVSVVLILWQHNLVMTLIAGVGAVLSIEWYFIRKKKQ